VGGQNVLIKSWPKFLAETLAPLLLGIDIDKEMLLGGSVLTIKKNCDQYMLLD
jgi:tRNA G10  N-methylase Trm11